jgi:hypothetical protein
MSDTPAVISTSASGTVEIGDELAVKRLGFGAMRLTGEGIWGEPPGERRKRQSG